MKFLWWCLGIIVFIAVIWLSVLMTFRVSGRQLYKEAFAEYQAAGHPITAEELVARVPPADVALVEQWVNTFDALDDSWWDDYRAIEEPLNKIIETGYLPYVEEGGLDNTGRSIRVFTRRQQALKEFAQACEPLWPLLDNQELRIGWIARYAYAKQQGTLPESTWEYSSPVLGPVRALQQYLFWQVVQHQAPMPWLRRMDQLVHSVRYDQSLIGCMIRIALMRIRDEAYLYAVRNKEVSNQDIQQWLAGSYQTELELLAAIETENVLSLFQAQEALESEGTLEVLGWAFGLESPHGSNLRETWMHFERDMAAVLSFRQFLCNYLVNNGDPSPVTHSQNQGLYDEFHSTPIMIVLPNFPESHITIWEAEADLRAYRMAAILSLRQREGIPFPEHDEGFAELYPNWLPRNDQAADLVYERVVGDGFTIRIDPKGNLPDVFDTDERQRMEKRSRFITVREKRPKPSARNNNVKRGKKVSLTLPGGDK